jgi:hypothetical protein
MQDTAVKYSAQFYPLYLSEQQQVDRGILFDAINHR